MVSGATSVEDLRRQVQGMALREIRTQLVSRGLGTSGTRGELEDRLYSALYRESGVRYGGNRVAATHKTYDMMSLLLCFSLCHVSVFDGRPLLMMPASEQAGDGAGDCLPSGSGRT